jgi:hypothetical protein
MTNEVLYVGGTQRCFDTEQFVRAVQGSDSEVVQVQEPKPELKTARGMAMLMGLYGALGGTNEMLPRSLRSNEPEEPTALNTLALRMKAVRQLNRAGFKNPTKAQIDTALAGLVATSRR